MKTHRLVYLLTITAACAIAPLHTRADEASALSLLKSTSTSLHEKAKACDELGRLGSAKAVPVLAKLLADEHLHDYARDGLERIPDASAGCRCSYQNRSWVALQGPDDEAADGR